METLGYWQKVSLARLRRRAFLGAGIAAGTGLSSMLLAGCSSGSGNKAKSTTQVSGTAGAVSTAGTVSAGKPGGTLMHSINDDPPSLNLWTEFTYIVASSVATIYNQLIQLDPLDESKVIGDLAKSWEFTNSDKTEIVYKLQDANVTWHDGQPFSAEDVKATFDWLSNLPKGVVSPRTTAARNIDKVEIVDPKTIRFHLKSPAASFLTSTSSHHYALGAKHIIDQTNTLLDKDQRPVGTGPFVFKDYKRSNVLDVERNKSYWRQGRPYLDGVTAFIISEPTTALTNFLSGQLNLLAPVSVSDLARLQKELGSKGVVEVTPSLSRVALIPNGSKPPFNDVRMREALSAAIDRDEFNQIIDEGKGFKGAYNNPKGQWALPESDLVKFSGYDGKADIAKAKQLMAAAGYPDGFKGRMPVRTDFEKNAVALQAQLKKAGFDFTIQVEKSAVLTQRANATDFDVLCHTWATPLDDPDDSFAEMLISPDRAGRNWAKITIPEVDKLFDQQRAEFDVAKRKQLSNACDRAALASYPNILVLYDPQIIARYVNVRDFKPHVSNYTNQRYENVWLSR
ncbi:MAG: ABC transporter substrate-binding protein [Dehalococcoidia bacterium]